jgi:hypothetical protein
MFLNHSQQFERHAAGLFAARLPLLNCGFTGVEVSSKHGLTYMRLLTNFFDLNANTGTPASVKLAPAEST